MLQFFSIPYATTLTSVWLLIARVAAGAAMLTHGWPKLQMLINGGAAKFPDPIGLGATASLSLAVFAEAVCAALLVIGLATRLAALPLLITMAVAFFIVHGGDPFAKRELAAMYLVVFGTIGVFGPGRFSIDQLIAGARGKRS
ncbi:MAG: DoxX family protein [Myxococcales bacterium]|nr:DoxX family protein [Myxococcales bacterium]